MACGHVRHRIEPRPYDAQLYSVRNEKGSFVRKLLGAWARINPSRTFLESWLAGAATGQSADFRVLDAGAGSAPYRHLFSQVIYETADFAQVDKEYGDLDYICDLNDIPVADNQYDLVLCTQVLEHVPHPVSVLQELARVTRPGGQIWLSAPLFYEEHEAPYDYHRYTQFAWHQMAEEAGLDVVEVAWLEGYYTTLAYQLSMAARVLPTWMMPIRVLFALLSGAFARLDLRTKRDEIGMCKNYRVILDVPRQRA